VGLGKDGLGVVLELDEGILRVRKEDLYLHDIAIHAEEPEELVARDSLWKILEHDGVLALLFDLVGFLLDQINLMFHSLHFLETPIALREEAHARWEGIVVAIVVAVASVTEVRKGLEGGRGGLHENLLVDVSSLNLDGI